jgi:putative transposase
LESNAMKRDITLTTALVSGAVETAYIGVQQSFERLCLAAGSRR